jgi:hypothetical protein
MLTLAALVSQQFASYLYNYMTTPRNERTITRVLMSVGSSLIRLNKEQLASTEEDFLFAFY